MTTHHAPVLFVSHGSPMLAVEPGLLGAKLAELGNHWDQVRGIVVVSPHWQTKGLKVGNHLQPETIHDFGGFPRALYTLNYPAPGSQDLAQQILHTLALSGIKAELDAEQGFDHGVWVPLLHLRPQADIPVVPVSLPEDATPESVLALGHALASLRTNGIAIIGSGSMTHNLYEFRGSEVTQPQKYVTEFSNWVRSAAQKRDLTKLLRYKTQAPHAARAHPTDEHFLPLFVALGASTEQDSMRVLDTEVRYGMLSMESYAWEKLGA
jgi:4,5-DOPA dioxygenase extradiol